MSRRSSRLSGGTGIVESIPTTGPSRLASNSASNQPSTSTQPESTDSIPYFEEWTTEALQSEVKRYGFKVSRKRSTLIDQLKAVYEALQWSKTPFEAPTHVDRETACNAEPELEPEPELSNGRRAKRKLILPEATIAGGARAKGKGRKSDPFVLDDASSDSSTSSSSVQIAADADGMQQEQGDFTAQLELEAASATDGEHSPPLSSVSSSPSSRLPLPASASPRKPRRSRSASSSSAEIPLSVLTASTSLTEAGEDEGSSIDPSPALAETMTIAIRSNANAWARILRYEPISFDEVVSIATQSGLAMDTGKRKEELRTWLDRQCICFYSAELTGSRSRH